MTLADYLKNYRKEHKLTQAQFAKLIGVSLRMVQYYECENKFPKMHILLEISKLLKVAPRDLMEGAVHWVRTAGSTPEMIADFILDAIHFEKMNSKEKEAFVKTFINKCRTYSKLNSFEQVDEWWL